jgi:formylmethanofuran dehydrogenase subunit C
MFKMITLAPLKKFEVPLVAACINPDVFEGKSLLNYLSMKETERRSLATCSK